MAKRASHAGDLRTASTLILQGSEHAWLSAPNPAEEDGRPLKNQVYIGPDGYSNPLITTSESIATSSLRFFADFCWVSFFFCCAELLYLNFILFSAAQKPIFHQ
jgi:hypothetical protein